MRTIAGASLTKFTVGAFKVGFPRPLIKNNKYLANY